MPAASREGALDPGAAGERDHDQVEEGAEGVLESVAALLGLAAHGQVGDEEEDDAEHDAGGERHGEREVEAGNRPAQGEQRRQRQPEHAEQHLLAEVVLERASDEAQVGLE